MKPQSFWNRRIPSVLGIVILIAGIVITSALVSTGVIFTGRAAPGNTPQGVVITNISDTSFTVTYNTGDTVLGSISYTNPADNKSVAFDVRDQKSGQPRPYKIHAITVSKLTPNTKYSFTITSGGGNFTNSGNDYIVTTGRKLSSIPSKNQEIKGKIVTSTGSAPSEALIYVESGSSQILSALTSNGSYSIPTTMLRTKNLNSYVSLAPSTKLKMQTVAPEGKATVSVLVKGSNPVPPITLTNKYDFAVTRDTTRIASQTAEVTGFPESEVDTGKQVSTITITAPKEGQALSDQRPTLKGTAPPSAEVEITIDSDEPIQTNVITDRRGSWSYRPKNPIPPGEATVTANARDGTGILRSTTQSFTILASGSQFTQPSVSPTKSAPTPTPTPESEEPTPTKRATPTQVVTPTPTQAVATPTVIAISPTPTALPTIAPTLVATIQPTSATPIPTIAPTGDNDAILYALIGAVAITIGAVLLFFTGGISF